MIIAAGRRVRKSFPGFGVQSTRRLRGVGYCDATKLMENFVFGIDIPIIAALNGPSIAHAEFARRPLAGELTWLWRGSHTAVARLSHGSDAAQPSDGSGFQFPSRDSRS